MLSLAFILCAVVAFLQTDTVAAQNAVTVSMSGFTSGPGGQRAIGTTSSQTGTAIAQVGDFNGDGTNDFVISAPFMTVNSLIRAGLVALVLGHSGNWSEIDLTVASGPTMMRVYGGVQLWQVGTSVGGAGDVNADGRDDLLISAPYLSNGGLTQCGAVFVIFGSPGPYGDVVLSNSFVAGSTGYAIYGPATSASLGNRATNTIGLLEDINGDGLDDFVVSTLSVSYKGRTSAGCVWIIYGSTSTPANIRLNSLQGTAGVMIAGGAAAGNSAGLSIDAVGDFNKDGVVDVLVGAYLYAPVVSGTTRTNAGAAYLLFGSSTFTSRDPDLANFVSGPEGVRFLGALQGDQLGQTVSGAGDLNGDGYADILIGAPTSLPGGKIYVVFGTETPYTSDVDMLAFNGGIAGYTVLGSSTIQQIGYSLSRAGDVNQDGLDDLLCTSYLSGAVAGQVSILFGSSVSPAANVDFSGPVTAYSFTGTSGSRLGSAVAGGFDVNNDGIPDIMLGAPFATVIPAAGGVQRGTAGAVYVVMGPLFLPTDQPTSAPSTQPSSRPSSQPSSQPSVQPSTQPTTSPSSLPTTQPTARPSSGPTSQPSSRPSAQPSAQPTSKPTNQPTTQPTVRPTTQPTSQPSSEPSSQPSSRPSVQPSVQPSSAPTHSAAPTAVPTVAFTTEPRAGSSPVLSDGGIAGVVVGGVVFLLLLITLGVMYCATQGAAAPAPTSEYEMAQVQEA